MEPGKWYKVQGTRSEQRGRNDNAPWGAEGPCLKAGKPGMSVEGRLGVPHKAKEEGEGVPIQKEQ